MSGRYGMTSTYKRDLMAMDEFRREFRREHADKLRHHDRIIAYMRDHGIQMMRLTPDAEARLGNRLMAMDAKRRTTIGGEEVMSGRFGKVAKDISRARDRKSATDEGDDGHAHAEALLASLGGGHKKLDRDEYDDLCRMIYRMYPDLRPLANIGGEDDEEDTPDQDRDWERQHSVVASSERHGPRSRVSDIPGEDDPPDLHGKPRGMLWDRYRGQLTGDAAIIRDALVNMQRIRSDPYMTASDMAMRRQTERANRTRKMIAMDARAAKYVMRNAASYAERFPDAARIRVMP
jgi:hypothetical protein